MTSTPAPALPGRIFEFNTDRDAIVAEVVEREFARKSPSESAIELAINDTAYQEIARLEASKGPAFERWHDLHRSLGGRSLADKQAIFRRLLRDNVMDIVGNFNPKVYRFATSLVPLGLSGLFRPQARGLNLSNSLQNRLQVTGHVDTLRALSQKGTVILVPTHSSNLDSVVIGYALYQLGLPPFTYGAGKNLFTNFLLSYFMNNLGAYKVDRRLTYTLYKDVLKAYSTVLLEKGYHSLFFPAGGRCRSNAVESKLKLGLLGTGLAAYINNLRAGKAQPNIYVVPATLNYHLVLEAETLIDDQLSRVGKSRYIIEDDESTRVRRIVSFVRQMLQLDTSMVIQIGEPLDPFGNRVDPDGISRDLRGRATDLRKYVEVKGEPAPSPQRDAEYTRELGAAIAASYRRNTVALSTHLFAFTLYQMLRQRHPALDVFQLLRLPDTTSFPVGEVLAAMARVREALRTLGDAQGILLDSHVWHDSPENLLGRALRIFGLYHTRPLALQDDGAIWPHDLKLLLYYHNRLTGFGLEGAVLGTLEARV